MNAKIPVKDCARLAMRNKIQINMSSACGCYYCGYIFPPTAIKEWTDDNWTALCPNCCVDSVLGSAHNVPITKEYLEVANRYWF